MRIRSLGCAVVFALNVIGRVAVAEPVVLPDAQQFDLTAKNGSEYRIFVAAPTSPPPAAGWPVIYLTDGNSNFPIVLGAVRRQAMGNNLPAVVVGIGYQSDEARVHMTRRTLDLTPRTSAQFLKNLPAGGPPGGAPSVEGTGGNDAFLAFIEEELKPHVEGKWKIDRGRQSLFGHSFGGLFALHVLFTKPECFQTYLASSPSIWWNDRSVLTEEQSFVARHSSSSVKARLFLSVGQWEEAAAPTEPPARAKILLERQQVTQGRELTNRLKASGIAGLGVEFREFPEETHGSVVLPAASRSVRFALDGTP